MEQKIFDILNFVILALLLLIVVSFIITIIALVKKKRRLLFVVILSVLIIIFVSLNVWQAVLQKEIMNNLFYSDNGGIPIDEFVDMVIGEIEK